MQKKPLTKTKPGARTVTVPSAARESMTAASGPTAPTHEEISRRAYEIYLARGQTGGRELEDWSQAERELLAKAHRNN